jgi:hypothetical protein
MAALNNKPLVDYDTAFTDFSTEVRARNLNFSLLTNNLYQDAT